MGKTDCLASTLSKIAHYTEIKYLVINCWCPKAMHVTLPLNSTIASVTQPLLAAMLPSTWNLLLSHGGHVLPAAHEIEVVT